MLTCILVFQSACQSRLSQTCQQIQKQNAFLKAQLKSFTAFEIIATNYYISQYHHKLLGTS